MKIRSGPWGSSIPSSLRLGIVVIAAVLIGASKGGVKLKTLDGQSVVACPQSAESIEVLHFWATWCPSCREDLLALDRASKACVDGPLVLAVNVGDSVEAIEAFLEGQEYATPFLRDPKGLAWRDAGGRALPANLICRGTEREMFVGPLDHEGWMDRLGTLGCSDSVEDKD